APRDQGADRDRDLVQRPAGSSVPRLPRRRPGSLRDGSRDAHVRDVRPVHAAGRPLLARGPRGRAGPRTPRGRGREHGGARRPHAFRNHRSLGDAGAVGPMLALVVAAVLASPATLATLRLDYFHTGTGGEGHFAGDGVVLEGPWAGRLDRAVDDTNLGQYLFEVVDRATNRVLFSRGFSTAYGEWETTDEAKEGSRTFHESLRFPEPAGPAQVVVKRRVKGLFREVWTTLVDPRDVTIDHTRAVGRVWDVEKNGDPADKVDLLLLGDGYTAAEMDKWHRDAKRLAEL